MIEEAIEVAKQREEERLNPKPVETAVAKPVAAAPSKGTVQTGNSGPKGQRQARSRSTGRGGNRRSTSKTPERSLVQEKMNKVAAARQESEDVKRKQAEERL